VLENAFRSFSTLTRGDIISIAYNEKLYSILVMECRPSEDGISIIETDLEVDFAAPLGYVEPARVPKKPTGPGHSLGGTTDSLHAHVIADDGDEMEFEAFGGGGMKLNGKKKSEGVDEARKGRSGIERLDLPDGMYFMGYPVVPVAVEGEKKIEKTPFEGLTDGNTLRASRKKKDAEEEL
jgi:ubiquitin fusion degradation protein 1